MPIPITLLTYERRIVATALVAVIPLAIAAGVLVWTGDFAPVATWTISLLIAASLLVVLVILREVVVYPIRTLGNVMRAVLEEDYTIRARDAAIGPIFAEVLLELNEVSAAMRQGRLAAMEAAAFVRAVMEEVDAAIFAFDAASRLQLVNRAGERLLGASAVGRTATELGVADLLEIEEPTTIERDFGGINARWSVSVSTFRREGELHHLLAIADISRALRQEEIRAWRRVVRVLSHELNNSLAPIKSISGTLEEAVAAGPVDARLQTDLAKGLGIISRRADALTRFLSVYSELARMPEPKLRAVELSTIVQRAVALDRRIDVVVQPGPPVRIEADEDQLEQVVINLVKNAIDAALETGGGVTISWRVASDAAELIVADEGPGLASTANLFVPFFTTKPGGSGIGLVLSRQIAEAHGGSLSLRNCEGGRGCEAVLRVPLSRDVTDR